MTHMVQMPDGQMEEIEKYENAPVLTARYIQVDHAKKFPAVLAAKTVQIEDSALEGLKEINATGIVRLKNVQGKAQTIKITAGEGLVFLNVKGVRLSADSVVKGMIMASSLTGIPKHLHNQVVRGAVKKKIDTHQFFLNPYFHKNRSR